MDLKTAEQTALADAQKGESFIKTHWVWAGPVLGVLVGLLLSHIL